MERWSHDRTQHSVRLSTTQGSHHRLSYHLTRSQCPESNGGPLYHLPALSPARSGREIHRNILTLKASENSDFLGGTTPSVTVLGSCWGTRTSRRKVAAFERFNGTNGAQMLSRGNRSVYGMSGGQPGRSHSFLREGTHGWTP